MVTGAAVLVEATEMIIPKATACPVALPVNLPVKGYIRQSAKAELLAALEPLYIAQTLL